MKIGAITLILLFMAGLCGLLLPACEGMRDVPVNARIIGPNGTVSYDDQSGLGVDIDARSGK